MDLEDNLLSEICQSWKGKSCRTPLIPRPDSKFIKDKKKSGCHGLGRGGLLFNGDRVLAPHKKCSGENAGDGCTMERT